MSLSNLLFSGIELVTSWSLPYRRRLKMLYSLMTFHKNSIKKYTDSDGINYLVHIASLTQYTNTPVCSKLSSILIICEINVIHDVEHSYYRKYFEHFFCMGENPVARVFCERRSQKSRVIRKSFFFEDFLSQNALRRVGYTLIVWELGKVRWFHGLRNLCVKQLIE